MNRTPLRQLSQAAANSSRRIDRGADESSKVNFDAFLNQKPTRLYLNHVNKEPSTTGQQTNHINNTPKNRSRGSPTVPPGFSSIFNPRNVFVVNGHPYIRVKKIGSGGSSKVYKVLCPKGNVFALKKVDISQSDPSIVQSFANEVQQLINLQSSDRVIKLIESEIDFRRQRILIVLELGDIDLAHLIQKNMSESRFVDRNFLRHIWEQMLEAVKVVHEHNLMHCDLKPANFMFVGGKLKLIDFGISSAISQEQNTTSVARDRPVGTISFMAPESFCYNTKHNEIRVGRPADVWALGCILYYLVFNRHPYGVNDPSILIDVIARGTKPIDYTLNQSNMNDPDMELIIDVLRLCLERDPKKRVTIDKLLNHCYLTMKRPEIDQSISEFICDVQDEDQDIDWESQEGQERISELASAFKERLPEAKPIIAETIQPPPHASRRGRMVGYGCL